MAKAIGLTLAEGKAVKNVVGSSLISLDFVAAGRLCMLALPKVAAPESRGCGGGWSFSVMSYRPILCCSRVADTWPI